MSAPPPSPEPPLLSAQRLDAALDWYGQQDKRVLGSLLAQGTFLAADAVTDVRAALASGAPLTGGQFDALVRFAHVMPELGRTNPGAPACNMGDMVTALQSVPPVVSGLDWDWQPTPDADVLGKLEVRETSLGIAQNQRNNRDAWWSHAERNRSFVEDAAALCPRRHRVVLLGVGPGSDLPLANLARQFEQVVLVDIDAAQLEETAARVFTDAATRARVTLQPMDLTGVNQQLIGRIDLVLEAASDGRDALNALTALARSYRLPGGPRLAPGGERADLIVSSCTLSQVSWPQRRYSKVAFERRFGPLPAQATQLFHSAWQEFELRVQQDHINALGAQADVAALTCDTVNHRTALDHSGTERQLGVNMYFLHARTLRDRIPAFLSVTRSGGWPWHLLKATRKNPEGVRVDVEAVMLRSGETG